MISVKNIWYKSNDTHLLRDISFSIDAGDVLAVLGSNGAGKSTLLKCLSKELTPEKGDVLFKKTLLGRWHNQELARNRAVLSQHYQVTLPFSVEQIVMMGRYPHFKNHPLPKDYDIVKESLAFAGISHLQHRNYLTLSGGEQQRTQIARVLSQLWEEDNNEKLLILDEPVSALDIQYQHHIMQLVGRLSERNFAVIAVLHDLNLALQYCNKALLLKKGEQVAFGDTGVIDRALIKKVYDVDSDLVYHAASNKNYIIITE
ncbi:MAG: heme ABC transporter ATP-binding protein [Chitinophagaceae bacterium]|nr:heme ABC transporter ATP-binding protein [Chitinophagaceae bacterium]MCW5925882.1 heme ABC transporter ATP-binding protein [Chitinophagaceae bacterium]